MVDGFCYGSGVRGVEDAGVDGDAGVGGCELGSEGGEVSGCEVADVEGAQAVGGVLVRGCTADSAGGVAAGDDRDFIGEAAVGV